MSRFVSILSLVSMYTMKSMIVDGSAILPPPPPPPNDRWVAVQKECGEEPGAPKRPPLFVACFSCNNIDDGQREGNNTDGQLPPPPPKNMSDHLVDPNQGQETMFPVLFNHSEHRIMKPRSVFVHCNMGQNATDEIKDHRLGEIYNIYYNEPNCRGKPIFDNIVGKDCPDCSTCKAPPNECLADPECDKRCCPPVLECSGCNNKNECDRNKDHCSGCPSCNVQQEQQGAPQGGDDQNPPPLGDDKPKNGSNHFIPSEGKYFQDLGDKLSIRNLFVGDNCTERDLVDARLVPSFNCTPISPHADNITLAVSVGCMRVGNGFMTNAIGFMNMGDCEAGVNPTFNITGGEGQCLITPSGRWSINAICGGWGRQPLPKPPKAPRIPMDGEIGVVIREEYPDKRCEQDPHKPPIQGNIRQCNVCIAEPNRMFHRYECGAMKNIIYTKPNCTGDIRVEEIKNCTGDVVRGVINEELDAGVPERFAFISEFGGDKCFAETVLVNEGIRSGNCSTIKMPDGKPMNVRVDCKTRTLISYKDDRCVEEAKATSFTDNQCSPLADFFVVPQQQGEQQKPLEGRISISCSGYRMPPLMPPSSVMPTFRPTNQGETREPTKSPTQRQCPPLTRGCSAYASNTCTDKSASWSIQGKSYQCKCKSTDKSSKVSFKLKVSSTTVQTINADKCILNGMFKGVYDKVYQTTQTSTINDFPVEAEGAAVQQGNDVIVSLNILGFLNTKLADQVVTYIKSNSNDISLAIGQALTPGGAGGPPNGTPNPSGAPQNGTPNPSGPNNGFSVSIVDGSVSRVDNVAFCGCADSIDSTQSGASSNFPSSTYIIQAIVAGISIASLASC